MSDISAILSTHDDAAREQLIPLVYSELRRLAASLLAQEKPGHTLQATALVHEAWLRLGAVNRDNLADNPELNRAQFFAAAAEAMRRILVDHARRKTAQKRGGGMGRLELAEEMLTVARPQEAIAVHDALDALAADDQLAADLVKLHYFAGFSIEEAAELLGMSRTEGYRSYRYARVWLRACLNGENEESGG